MTKAAGEKRQTLGMGPKGLRDALDEKAPAERQRALTAHASEDLNFRHAIEVRNEAVSEAERYMPGVERADAERILAAVELRVAPCSPPLVSDGVAPRTGSHSRKAAETAPRLQKALVGAPSAEASGDETASKCATSRSGNVLRWIGVVAALALLSAAYLTLRESPVGTARPSARAASATATLVAVDSGVATTSGWPITEQSTDSGAPTGATQPLPSAKVSARQAKRAVSAQVIAPSSSSTSPSGWDGWDLQPSEQIRSKQ